MKSLIWGILIFTSLTTYGDDICTTLQLARKHNKVLLNPDYVDQITRSKVTQGIRMASDVGVLALVNGNVIISNSKNQQIQAALAKAKDALAAEPLSIKLEDLVTEGYQEGKWDRILTESNPIDNLRGLRLPTQSPTDFRNGVEYVAEVRKLNPGATITEELAGDISNMANRHRIALENSTTHMRAIKYRTSNIMTAVDAANTEIKVIETGLNNAANTTSRFGRFLRLGTKGAINMMVLSDLGFMAWEVYLIMNAGKWAVERDPRILLLPSISDKTACEGAKKVKAAHPTIVSWALLAKAYESDKENLDKGFINLDKIIHSQNESDRLPLDNTLLTPPHVR